MHTQCNTLGSSVCLTWVDGCGRRLHRTENRHTVAVVCTEQRTDIPWPSYAQNREQTYRGRRMHRTENRHTVAVVCTEQRTDIPWPSYAQNREQTYRGRRMHRTETGIRSANIKARGTNQGTEQLTGEITTGADTTGAGPRGTTEGADAAAQGTP